MRGPKMAQRAQPALQVLVSDGFHNFLAMGRRDAYQKVLIHACAVRGDETALAETLGVPVEQVVDWILGHRPVPPGYFLKAVDIVLAEHKQQVVDVKAFLEKMRRQRPVRDKKA